MFFFKKAKVRTYEFGLHFRDGEFQGLLPPRARRYWKFDPLGRERIDVVSQRAPWFTHEKLDLIVKSGALRERAVVLDLKDYQRALVWIDGRFSHVLPPGLYVYWTAYCDIKTEVVDARLARFEHADLALIVESPQAGRLLDVTTLEAGHVGVLFRDGAFVETLPPGRYAFWKSGARVKVVPVDLRETMIDVSGQEIMTADKVSVRLNMVVAYRVVDARLSVSQVDDARQTLYREAQLVLRAVVGARELDAFLTAKDAVVAELTDALRPRATAFGLEVLSVGIRDVILPGEMKELLNKVTQAKKAAEANLIARREETAAMRSQSNTAKLLQENPTLMRMRELEVLEKLAATAKLSVVLGEKGLTERLVNVL
jgi:regulator of protease activity HflC (stomatin/prohibitin superfamily)